MKMKTMVGKIALAALLALTFVAPARKANASSVSGTFTTVSSTGPFFYAHQGAKMTVTVSGTFVGTIALMRSLDGVNFAADPSAMSFTAAGSQTLLIQTPANQNAYYRTDVTAYTSGSITTTLADFNNQFASRVNTFGVSIEDFYDNGVDLPSGSQLGVSNPVVFGKAFRPLLRTKAQLVLIVPVAGDVYSCSDCTHTYSLFSATGTAVDQFRESGLTTGVQ